MSTVVGLAAAVAACAISLSAQTSRAREAELRAAQYQEQIQGDVSGAIATYKKLAESAERDIAASALLALAEVYERLGRSEASSTLARVATDFRGTAAATTAQRKLGAIEQRPAGLIQKAIVTGTDANQNWSAVSPDGRYLPFTHSTGHVAIRDLRNGKITVVTATENGGGGLVESSVWSPDGRQIAYSWWPDGPDGMELRVIARQGGTPRVLLVNKDVEWLQPMAWAPDGEAILAEVETAKATEMWLISVATGSHRTVRFSRAPDRVVFSPDGRHLAYDYSMPGAPMRDISIVGVDGSNDRPLVTSPDDDFLLGWFPDGRHVLFGSDRLNTPGAWAIGVANGEPQGQPSLIKADIGRTSALGFDNDGRFYSELSVAGGDVFIAEVDPETGKMTQQARPAPKAQPLARRSQATWSRDGQQIVYVQSVQGRGTSLVVQNIATGAVVARPVQLSNIERPAWFPDGTAVAVEATGTSGRGVFRVDLRTGDVTSLGSAGQNYWGLSPDGESLLFRRAEKGTSILWRRVFADSSEHKVRQGPDGEAVWSPDGTAIAVMIRNEKGSSLVVVPPAGGSERTVVTDIPDALNWLAWSADGKHIFYVANRRELWRVAAVGGEGMATGIHVPLPKHISVNSDGKRIAISGGATQMEVWVWENLFKK
jgi:Tol biopolymer transport system component